ncbi:PREDICTED: uncharacterized protein LOC105568230 [Vollenhovia emeryi]|uniref:uncharacterized protein LOC105568230 n=1 Tax=Vollenhovia emeryi TaxID=411798 RepID=UPI0005F412CC|nr:PREDICTED: uncharacterized protein LOC105568230 [Vollenhovia emeryi]
MSLDVTALFTNIPKELVVEAIKKRWSEISPNTLLNLPQFLHAIELILNSTSFKFDGQFYEQIFGSPMGSPLSPILADMVMKDLEVSCLQRLDFNVPIFYRYVDDIITALPTTKIDTVLAIFNNHHPRLKFTYEMESNNSISFLDVTLTKTDKNNILTNWYQKPTFSGRYINYHSSHPFKYKTNTIISLVDHAILLSDKIYWKQNIALVKKILLNNCFPDKIIDKHINITQVEICLNLPRLSTGPG